MRLERKQTYRPILVKVEKDDEKINKLPKRNVSTVTTATDSTVATSTIAINEDKLNMVTMDLCPCLDITCPGCLTIPCPSCETLIIKNVCKCKLEQVISTPDLTGYNIINRRRSENPTKAKISVRDYKKRKLSSSSGVSRSKDSPNKNNNNININKVQQIPQSFSNSGNFNLPETPPSLADVNEQMPMATRGDVDDGLFF